MKFKWNLEKVLDIRKTQEQILKAELFRITQQQLNVQQKIILLQMQVRNSAAKLDELAPQQRLSQQSNFINYSFRVNNKIRQMNKELEDIRKQKEKKLQEHIQARKARKAMEKIREKKYEEFMYEQKKNELNFLDDLTSVKTIREKTGLQ